MRVNNFSLMVSEGRERDSGHVELAHNTVFTIKIGNHDANRHCDAMVTVDGKDLGGFRIRAGSTLTLERSAYDNGRFTFFEANSQQAQDANARGIAADSRGLVQVIFRPERKRIEREEKTSGGIRGQSMGGMRGGDYGSSAPLSFAPQNVTAGITGLTGHSDQSFYSVPNLDYEPNAEVTISLRLVCAAGVRELREAPKANAVPSPV